MSSVKPRRRPAAIRILLDDLHYAQMQARQDIAGYRRSIEKARQIGALLRAAQRQAGQRRKRSPARQLYLPTFPGRRLKD